MRGSRRNRIEIRGADKAAARLRGIARRAENPEPALARLPRTLEQHVAETFATRGASTGKPWKPLSAAWRVRKGSLPPLVYTGALRSSFERGQPYHYEALSKTRLRWGTRAPHARLHQAGTKGGQMPARPVVVVTPALRSEVTGKVRNYVVRGRL